MTKKPVYDIAVIGGGLAGLSVAIRGAQQGYAVALFEKEEYPFHKVCGEYISLESRPFLESLGIDLKQMDLPLIKSLGVSDPYGELYRFELDLGGFGISRYKLDHALSQVALRLGVDVFTATKVTDVYFEEDRISIMCGNEQFKATVASGSFGKRSNLDVKMKRPFVLKKPDKLNNFIGVKYHVKYPQPKHEILLHNFEDGYCGISSVEDDKYCLCYLTTANNLQACGNSVKQMEQQILWKNPHLKNIFINAEFLYPQPLTISQISFEKKSQVCNHLLMTGDASGMIAPLCGNGMSMAMHAGKIAFDCMHMFLQKEISRTKMEEMYTHQWKRQFSNRLRAGRLVQTLFGGKWSTALFLKTVNAIPSLSKQIIRLTHGEPF